jgi:hypothetical protein
MPDKLKSTRGFLRSIKGLKDRGLKLKLEKSFGALSAVPTCPSFSYHIILMKSEFK